MKVLTFCLHCVLKLKKKLFWGIFESVQNSKLIKHGPVVWLFYNSCCKMSRTFCLENRLNPPENKFCYHRIPPKKIFATTEYRRKKILLPQNPPEKNTYDNIPPGKIFQPNVPKAHWTKSVHELWFGDFFSKRSKKSPSGDFSKIPKRSDSKMSIFFNAFELHRLSTSNSFCMI